MRRRPLLSGLVAILLGASPAWADSPCATEGAEALPAGDAALTAFLEADYAGFLDRIGPLRERSEEANARMLTSLTEGLSGLDLDGCWVLATSRPSDFAATQVVVFRDSARERHVVLHLVMLTLDGAESGRILSFDIDSDLNVLLTYLP